MSFALMIIGLALALELLCWFQFDRLLRSLRTGPWSRTLWSLFMAAHVLCLLWVVFGRSIIPHPEDDLPRWVVAATFMWHLLILPSTMIVWMTVGTGRGVVEVLRRIRSAPKEQADTAPQLASSAEL